MKGSLYFFLFGQILLISCDEKNINNSVIYIEGTSIDSFKQITQYPYAIKQVHWLIEKHNNNGGRSIPGPDDWLIIAEIKGDAESVRNLANKCRNANLQISNEIYLSPTLKKDWFSQNLKNHFLRPTIRLF